MRVMVTLNKYGTRVNREWLELFGLSSDEKPIKVFEGRFIGNASLFMEMDTGSVYMYDEDGEKWWEV